MSDVESRKLETQKPKETPHVKKIFRNLSRKICEDMLCYVEDEKNTTQFIESMRSAPEFVELAKSLADKIKIKDKKLTLVYPASGSHIAPVMIVAEFIKTGKVESAELIYTETDEKVFRELQENLVYLEKSNPDFKVINTEEIKLPSEGREFVVRMSYKGKEIIFRFQLSLSTGENWFNKEEFAKSDVFISHDIGEDVGQKAFALHQYKNARDLTNKSNTPPIIIEDLTNTSSDYPDSSRVFDLELFGQMLRGKHAYGHRQKFGESEIGENTSKNGTILFPTPEVLKLSQEEFDTLLDIELTSNNELKLDAKKGGVIRNMVDSKFELRSQENLENILKNALEIFAAIEKTNPKLAEGFLMRTLSALSKLIISEGSNTWYAPGSPVFILIKDNPSYKANITTLLTLIETKVQHKSNTFNTILITLKRCVETIEESIGDPKIDEKVDALVPRDFHKLNRLLKIETDKYFDELKTAVN